MGEGVLLALVVVTLLAAVAALVAGLMALSRTGAGQTRRRSAKRDAASLPSDVGGLREEVAALRAEVRGAMRHLSVVRYDAFGDMGGRLSWSVALLDDAGDGVVLTSIHGRSEARTYAKSIAGWECEQSLSPEEEEAVKLARTA